MASIFSKNSSYTVFLTTSFPTTLLSLLKSAEVVSNLPITNLSISGFKLAKSTFLPKSDAYQHMLRFLSCFFVT